MLTTFLDLPPPPLPEWFELSITENKAAKALREHTWKQLRQRLPLVLATKSESRLASVARVLAAIFAAEQEPDELQKLHLNIGDACLKATITALKNNAGTHTTPTRVGLIVLAGCLLRHRSSDRSLSDSLGTLRQQLQLGGKDGSDGRRAAAWALGAADELSSLPALTSLCTIKDEKVSLEARRAVEALLERPLKELGNNKLNIEISELKDFLYERFGREIGNMDTLSRAISERLGHPINGIPPLGLGVRDQKVSFPKNMRPLPYQKKSESNKKSNLTQIKKPKIKPVGQKSSEEALSSLPRLTVKLINVLRGNRFKVFLENSPFLQIRTNATEVDIRKLLPPGLVLNGNTVVEDGKETRIHWAKTQSSAHAPTAERPRSFWRIICGILGALAVVGGLYFLVFTCIEAIHDFQQVTGSGAANAEGTLEKVITRRYEPKSQIKGPQGPPKCEIIQIFNYSWDGQSSMGERVIPGWIECSKVEFEKHVKNATAELPLGSKRNLFFYPWRLDVVAFEISELPQTGAASVFAIFFGLTLRLVICFIFIAGGAIALLFSFREKGLERRGLDG